MSMRNMSNRGLSKRNIVASVVAVGGLAFVLASPLSVFGSARSTIGSNAAATQASKAFTAVLTGAAEAPAPGDTDGNGAAAVSITPDSGEVCVDLRVGNIATATAAHIHRGAAGVAGPVVITLTAPNPTSATCVPAGAALAAEIAATPAAFYVNVHNGDFPGGAVRGQLAAPVTASGSVQLLNEPVRAYDSRTAPEGILAVSTTRVVSLATGVNGAGATVIAVPPGAVGAYVRLTITNAVNAGFVTLYSNALAVQPATSTANWYETGAIVGADATVAVDAQARVKVFAGANSTHFVIDVVGYLF